MGAFSGKTIANRRLEFRRFAGLAASKNILEPCKDSKSLIVAYLGQRHVSNRTRRTIYLTLSAFFDYLVTEDLVLENPLESLPSPKAYAPEADFLTDEEFRAFLRSVVNISAERLLDRNLLLVGLLYVLCLRVSEAAGLVLSDLDITSCPGAIRVRRKGGKQARIPLNTELRELLDAWLEERHRWAGEDSPWVFVFTRGKPLSIRQIQTLIRRALEKAGLVKGHLGPHLLRHSGASRHLRSGMNIRLIQDLLGHSNLATTSRYVHTTAAALETALQKYGLWDNRNDARSPVDGL